MLSQRLTRLIPAGGQPCHSEHQGQCWLAVAAWKGGNSRWIRRLQFPYWERGAARPASAPAVPDFGQPDVPSCDVLVHATCWLCPAGLCRQGLQRALCWCQTVPGTAHALAGAAARLCIDPHFSLPYAGEGHRLLEVSWVDASGQASCCCYL